jgi:hypothetical protein
MASAVMAAVLASANYIAQGTNQLLTNFTTYVNGAQTISTSSDTVGNEAWRASNGNTADYWQGTPQTATWSIDFGSQKIISSYSITPRQDVTTTAPTAFTLRASLDNVTFVTINTQSGLTWTTATKTFTIANPNYYRYYEIVPTTSGTGSNVGFAEIALLN